MNVFVAGATGVLGRRLVERFAQRGDTVVGLTRDDEGDEIVAEHGGEPHRGDVIDEESLVEGAKGADVVVHAATAIPTKNRPTAEDWEVNDRVRREGAKNLTSAAAEVGADLYVQQSIAWVARQPDGSRFDEHSPPNPDRTTRSALDAERIATTASREHDFDASVLRCGWFYAADSEQTQQLGENVASRTMPILGAGLLGREDATLSTIHVDDAADAFVAAVDERVTGIFHVVDDEPMTLAEFLETFAAELDVSSPWRLPSWLLRPVVGKDGVRFFTESMPTSNDRFCDATEWEPTYSTHEEGLERVVEVWESNEGPTIST